MNREVMIFSQICGLIVHPLSNHSLVADQRSLTGAQGIF